MKSVLFYKFQVLVFFSVSFPLLSQTPQVAIELEKINVLYIGLDNPVKIISNVNYDSVTVYNGKSYSYKYNDLHEITDSTLVDNSCKIYKSEGDNSYLIQPSSSSNFCELKVYLKGKVIESRKFRVKRVPLAKIIIENVQIGKTIKKSELSLLSSLQCEIDIDYDVKFSVISFDISKSVKGKYFERRINGNTISSETKLWLNDLSPKDKLIFENIKVKGLDGSIMAYPPIILEIMK